MIMPIGSDPSGILRRLEHVLASFALPRVRGVCGSRTLRSFLAIAQDTAGTFVMVPHFWAVYYHDGVQGPIHPRVAKLLVWFTNPADDPRHRGRYPIRDWQVTRLEREEFLEGLAENRRRGPGAEPFMRVARSTRGIPPHPFFVRGLDGAIAAGGGAAVRREFSRIVQASIDDASDTAMGVI